MVKCSELQMYHFSAHSYKTSETTLLQRNGYWSCKNKIRIEFVVFWVAALCVVAGYQCDAKYWAAWYCKMMVSNHHTTQHNNPEKHKFCSKRSKSGNNTVSIAGN
jgi:hypothetical protein